MLSNVGLSSRGEQARFGIDPASIGLVECHGRIACWGFLEGMTKCVYKCGVGDVERFQWRMPPAIAGAEWFLAWRHSWASSKSSKSSSSSAAASTGSAVIDVTGDDDDDDDDDDNDTDMDDGDDNNDHKKRKNSSKKKRKKQEEQQEDEGRAALDIESLSVAALKKEWMGPAEA